MKIVKLSINGPSASILRQSPNGDGVWGQYKFEVNNDIDSCDYWFVYSKGRPFTETTCAPQGNVFLITGEPESIYHYSAAFVRQFDTVITTRNDIRAEKVVRSHPAQPWWVGRKLGFGASGADDFTMSFLDLQNTKPKKTKLLSVITSNKAFTKGHNQRIKFVKALKSHFGDSIDVFGKGFNEFEDKWSVLQEYKYHVAIENSSSEHYWTEKLADSFLAQCFPLYYGAPNISEYFHNESLRKIDILDIPESIRIIEETIDADLYEKRLSFIDSAKDEVLNTHNILPYIAKFCDALPSDGPRRPTQIRNEMAYLDPGKLRMIAGRIFYQNFRPQSL